MMKAFTIIIISFITILQAARADLPPDLIDVGKNYFARGVNDSGNIVAANSSGIGAVWNKSANSWTSLLPAPGGFLYSYPNAINNAGKIVGQSSGYPNNSFTHTATSWNSGGAGTDLGSDACEVKDAFSDAYEISDSGNIAGTSATIINGGCTGPFPAGGSPLGMLISNPDQYAGGSGAVDVNDSGVYIGYYPNVGVAGIFTNSGVTPIGFSPVRILSDGTIIGQGFGGGGIKKRSPSGTIENIPCGSYAVDANEIGDILTTDFSTLRIWHQGSCYNISSILPADKPGYSFPAGSDSSLNNLGQIATNAFRPGESGSYSNTTVVLLTPKYPLAIQVVATPTGSPGEYEFETQAVRGTPVGSTKWDFGDGSTTNAAVGTKVKKKFTKPGIYSVKATVQDSQGSTAVNMIQINVATPTLQIGISVPNYQNLEVPLGEDFVINVSVSVANDGVGDLSELAFRGGTFTVSDGSILAFTTAATSPFSVSPGTGNNYPLNVRAAALGSADLNSLIIGKDAAGKSVSATDKKTIIVKPGDLIETVKPNKALLEKIGEAQQLLKSFKEKPTKKQKEAQNVIKERLKVLSAELVSYLNTHTTVITATSIKVKLPQLASAAKKALAQAIKRKSTFAEDKKAAKKALTTLQKSIAL